MTLLGASVTMLGIALVMQALNHDKLRKRVDKLESTYQGVKQHNPNKL